MRDSAKRKEGPFISYHLVDNSLDEESFQFIRSLILKVAGISLSENKKSMVQSRLFKRMLALAVKTIPDYLNYLKDNSSELGNFINALTTNKTDFFREVEHFNRLRDEFLPEIARRKSGEKKGVSFWSAACSTGPEVYTIAMVMQDFVCKHPGLDYKIWGTDIDTEVIHKAEAAIYGEDEMAPIPEEFLRSSFVRGTGKNVGLYKVVDSLKEKIRFRQHNLIEPLVGFQINFDFIFLRNVLIYFQLPVIQKVIDNVVAHLEPG
ncbi:MAG: hypothetical protein A2451_01210, partial [Bdellovibrionales bacterium RIFOXYC2_FULL_39_8]